MTAMTPLWLDRPRATHPTAKVSILQGTRLGRILRTNPPSVLRDYVTANQEGQSWLRRFCDAQYVGYQDRPAYTYATTRAGELRARAELAVAELAGLDATWQETTELPFPVRGAVHLADQMQLHPLELLDAVVAQLVAEGGELFEHSRLTDVRHRGGHVTVTTEQTTVTARAGSEAQHLDELLAWALTSFGGEVTHTWSAQDQATVSGLPYVGPMLPGAHSIWVATGFDKWGLAAAPAAALLLTKAILEQDGAGDRPSWHRAFSTWTPRETVGAARAAGYTVGVGLEAAKDVVRRRWRDAEHAEPAVRGVCTHLGGAVRWNDAERSWDCPLHGSRFDTDGAVLEGPAVCGLRKL